MQNSYSAIIKKTGDFWIGWIKEIPGVNCQEKTKTELIESLKITLDEAIEFNIEEALSAIGENLTEHPLVPCYKEGR